MWNLPVLWKLILRKETLKSDMTFNNQWERDCVNMLMISVATWGHVTFRFIYIFVLRLSFLFWKKQNEGLCFSLGYLLWKRYIVWASVSAVWRVLVTIHSTDVGAPNEHGMFSHELLSEWNSALIDGQWQSWVWLQSDIETVLYSWSCLSGWNVQLMGSMST